MEEQMKYTNVRKINAFNVYADLDDFDVIIEVEAPEDMAKAMAGAQDGFDEWYDDDDSGDTLLERIESKLNERRIVYTVTPASFQNEYVTDLEEECENLTEQIRLMTTHDQEK